MVFVPKGESILVTKVRLEQPCIRTRQLSRNQVDAAVVKVVRQSADTEPARTRKALPTSGQRITTGEKNRTLHKNREGCGTQFFSWLDLRYGKFSPGFSTKHGKQNNRGPTDLLVFVHVATHQKKFVNLLLFAASLFGLIGGELAVTEVLEYFAFLAGFFVPQELLLSGTLKFR